MLNVAVVDDYPLEGKTIEFLLKKNRPQINYLGQALSGEEGLALIEHNQVDVAFLDIKMPGMSGIELAARLKEAAPQTRVVFVTAFDDFEFIQSALRLGASDYLLKPIRPDDLYRIVDAAQAAASPGAPRAGRPGEEAVAQRRLLEEIQNGDRRSVEEAFDSYWEVLLRASHGQLPAMHGRVKRLVRAAASQCAELGGAPKAEVLELLARDLQGEADRVDTPGALEACTRDFALQCVRVYDDGLCESGNAQIEQAKALIEQMLDQELTLELVAQKVFISPFYLSRLFKKCTGVNFLDYIIQCRIERAKTLLLTTNRTVEAVSVAVGYEEPNSFRRLFKRRTGMSPGEYRRLGKRGGDD